MKSTLTARLLLALLIVLPQSVLPATITVDGQTGDPPGTSCDLVEAIENANDTTTGQPNPDCTAGNPAGGDTLILTEDVTLDTVDNTYAGSTGLPAVVSAIEIQGNDFTIRRDGAAEDFRIFMVDGFAGDLTLRNTTVSDGKLGGVVGGGIYARGNLTLIGSTIARSQTASNGGAIAASGDLYGGTVTLANSTLAGNSAHSGGGLRVSLNTTATLTNSTLVGNSAVGYGGGIHSAGTVTLTNSTLSRNSAGLNGGGINTVQGTTLLINSTLSGNSADGEGGALALFELFGGAITARYSLLANSGSGGNCDGMIINNGLNLADDSTCGTISGTLSGLDPILADNGGPTMTHALLPTSNARDHARPAVPRRISEAREGGGL